jgi:hypothetical protein
MRLIIIAAAAGIQFFAGATYAQYRPAIVEYPPVPIAPGDIINYCIYESRIYSIGSGFCFGRIGYVCLPSTGPATGNRAYWSSKEDQLFPRPTCS